MKSNGFDPNEYSCIYNLVKNDGSKLSKVFTDNEIENTIIFDGTCPETFSMRANKMTKQFNASFFASRSNQTKRGFVSVVSRRRSEMHFLTERERRMLAAKQNQERKQVVVRVACEV